MSGERGPSILLVEDDRETRGALSRGLRERGYHCTEVSSGEEALELLEELDDSEPDAALLEVRLPEMDGVELAARLKERAHPESFLPVMVLGGVDGVEERVRAFSAGCDDFIGKPVSLFELDARLSSLLARRAQQEELRRANARLRASHEKKRELAALVVHDLRSPLSALLGNTEMLRDVLGDGADPAARRLVGDMEELASRALSMVAGILDVEEMEEGLLVAKPEEVELAPFVQEVSRYHRATAELRSLSIEFEAEEGMRGRFDPQLISRVLENLLDNAVRYAPKGGRVVVSAAKEEGALVLRVGNSGPPVPERERPRIFDRYYRLEARRAGARANRGLGLYFCRLAAEAHGGRITIEQLPELPACFAVRLPG